jgi:hypothetical protein
LGVNNVQWFEFVLTFPSGQVIQGHPQPSEGIKPQENFRIGPGEDYKQELILNQWFELDTPGKYLLTARLNTVIDVGRMGAVSPPAQTLPLEIKPRDIYRLRKVCAQLASQVENATSVEEERQPALKLSYVNDAIAVPYLAQVLAKHMFNHNLAIAGLERIGNDAAIEVLLTTMNDTYGDMGDLSRQALTRVQDRIPNANLKETVRRALGSKRSD